MTKGVDSRTFQPQKSLSATKTVGVFVANEDLHGRSILNSTPFVIATRSAQKTSETTLADYHDIPNVLIEPKSFSIKVLLTVNWHHIAKLDYTTRATTIQKAQHGIVVVFL